MVALALSGILKKFNELTYLKAGIYQPKMLYALELSAYSLIAFITPLLLAHSQLMLGAIVNSMLICGALYTKGKKMLPLIFLPSLGVFANGILFGPLTIYLLYMLPFIWAGNAILIYSIKGLHLKKKIGFLKSAAYGSLLKASFLFASAFSLYALGVVPGQFLNIFGAMQFVTAFAAGAVLCPVHCWRTKKAKGR
jgi:hypothetical protein